MSGDSGQSVHIRRSQPDFGIMILRMLEGEERHACFLCLLFGKWTEAHIPAYQGDFGNK
jgi:hypothetical protein